ncbi:MAG: UDP-glucose 4-epimerase GalE [Burkholderiales bacterium]
MHVVVTGGLGYIGSHCCVELARAGHRLRIVDNLANSKLSVLERIRELAPGAAIDFIRADVRDANALDRVLAGAGADAVMHFAGLKAVAESVADPARYHDNNVGGTKVLLAAMDRHGVERFVFSSSATVYGDPEFLPYTERHRLKPMNPYGDTKLAVERLLEARAAARASFLHATLRYFNPIGAHPSGRIGEDPRGAPENLLPYLTRVALGQLPRLRVFGGDYDTADGTGVRDYIHVMDLAAGHLAALRYLQERRRSITANLGAGRGHSVLEVIRAFERVTGRKVPYEIVARRPGDLPAYYADASLAARELGWSAQLGIEDMCRDAWRWQSDNPSGYPD